MGKSPKDIQMVSKHPLSARQYTLETNSSHDFHLATRSSRQWCIDSTLLSESHTLIVRSEKN